MRFADVARVKPHIPENSLVHVWRSGAKSAEGNFCRTDVAPVFILSVLQHPSGGLLRARVDLQAVSTGAGGNVRTGHPRWTTA